MLSQRYSTASAAALAAASSCLGTEAYLWNIGRPNFTIHSNANQKPKTSTALDVSLPIPAEKTTVHGITTRQPYPLPELPIPPPLWANEPGTFAYDTIARRVNEEVLQRTFEDIQEDLETPCFARIHERFQELRSELQNAATEKLKHLDPLPPDASTEQIQEWYQWYHILKPWIEKGETWQSAPWMVTDFYVYRRLMQVLGFWEKGTPGYMYDPFAKQKRDGLVSSVGSAEPMLAKISNLPRNSEGVRLAASFSLWGNKMDLSLWPANVDDADVDVFSNILAGATENLLNDDSQLLGEQCDKLRSMGGGNVHIILDNAGFETVADLALSQHLIQSGVAKSVTFQVKPHPYIVSDAMKKDVIETIDYFANLDPFHYPNARAAGRLWKHYVDIGCFKFNQDSFWVQPLAMWEMREPLRTYMEQNCDLAFVKGDANYRRLLGDRQWDLTAPFQKVVGAYFPCPVCALRTLKAEVGCGMNAEKIKRAEAQDKNWMITGSFGVVHYGTGATTRN